MPTARTYRIAASLLSADFARLGDELCTVIEAGAHLDSFRTVIDSMRAQLAR